MGTENLNRIVTAVGKIVSSVYSLLNGGGFMVLVEIFNQVLSLRGLDLKAAVEEIKDLNEPERLGLEQAFEMALTLPAEHQEKARALIGSLEDLISLVAESISVGQRAIDLVAQVRAVLGV